MGYSRYIYFASYAKSAPDAVDFVNSLNSDLASVNFSREDFKKNSESLQYIQNFLSKIAGMARVQRSNQLQYIKSKFSELNIQDAYFKNNTFDYINFIKDLNLTMKNLDQFKDTLKTFRERIEDINKALNYAKGNQYNLSEDGPKEIISRQRANELYKAHKMPEYRAMIMAAVQQYNQAHKTATISIKDTINKKIAIALPKIIREIASTPSFRIFIENQLQTGQVETDQLKGIILHAAISFLKIDLKGDVQKALTDSIDLSRADIENYLKEGIQISYNNILQSDGISIQQFFQKALLAQSGQGLAASFEQVRDKFKIDSNTEMGKIIKQLSDKLIEGIKAGQPETSRAKRKFSQQMRKIILDMKKQINEPINEKNVHSLFSKIKDKFISYGQNITDNINLDDIFNQCFKIDSVKGSSMAQIIGAVEALIRNKGGNVFEVFVPGDKIMLKNDFSFTYHVEDVPEIEFKSPRDNETARTLQDLIEHQGRDFLVNYDSITKGATDIKVAYSQYIETLKKINAQRQKLISSADSKEIEHIKKILQDFFVNVSVKEYQFYNNSVGYGAGSLGGGGKVTVAVPQLLNMIQLGGITVPDAQAVINALLNSFPESIIGTGYIKDLQNFLLVGAAMMLFDDGFTAGEQFLKDIQSIFDDMSIPSLHLMLLDGIYIPQSYILQNIYQNLTKVYQDILSNFGQLAQGRTTHGAAASLVVHNDIDSTVLKQMQEKKGDPWKNMSNYAQKNVTISYFFMAGMLDIVSQLNGILK